MSLDVPHRWELQIERIAQSNHISTDEALERVIRAGVERLEPRSIDAGVSPQRSYASFFGVIKGPGAHGSKEAVDRYLTELRDEW